MATIHELISQIPDDDLRTRIENEFSKISKSKKFGLVFEEHIPECTPLYDIHIKKGHMVSSIRGDIKDIYYVQSIKGEEAICVNRITGESSTMFVKELVVVAEFGQPIYPYLKFVDSVSNAPEDKLWHTLIEADNYHALQLLEYLYAGKVDCIYIDPPYNTGARDWKYNNNYIDGNDSYRHSKWLSMMQKRLNLAKKLLNPKDSVLIVTIDEKEYIHLGCLLEEMFPYANIQMLTDVINAKGVARINQFSRVEEYIYVVSIGSAQPALTEDSMLDFEITGNYQQNVGDTVPWSRMLRRGSNSHREHSENCFYPIFVDEEREVIVDVGFPPGRGVDRETISIPNGCVAVWPMHNNNVEGCWQLSRPKFVQALADGTAKLGRKNKIGQWSINYLNQGLLNEIAEGSIVITGKDTKGAVILERVENKLISAKSVWTRKSHDASLYGSVLLSSMIGKRFSYPKSLYSERDIINFFVANKPNALIVDFFAGSGTTLHAVNLINSEDNGKRRCILVTNNEVSETENIELSAKGYHPGDDEWDKYGIARYVTWPRTVCSVLGTDVYGKPLKGNYLSNDRPMKDGFQSNVAFLKLGFLDKTSIALGQQLAALIPVLWLKSGANGECPSICEVNSDMIVLPDNNFAVLVNEKYFKDFALEVNQNPNISTLYFVTDSDAGYREMISYFPDKTVYQLYRDYLDSFRINVRR